jgi:hypothetical protein
LTQQDQRLPEIQSLVASGRAGLTRFVYPYVLLYSAPPEMITGEFVRAGGWPMMRRGE